MIEASREKSIPTAFVKTCPWICAPSAQASSIHSASNCTSFMLMETGTPVSRDMVFHISRISGSRMPSSAASYTARPPRAMASPSALTSRAEASVPGTTLPQMSWC